MNKLNEPKTKILQKNIYLFFVSRFSMLNQPLEFDRCLWPVYSFAGGPTQLPRTILKKIKENFLNFNNTGLSIGEISARSKEFHEIYTSATDDLKSLYKLPSDFKIYFGQGGATLIFETICYNLLQDNNTVSYANTGHWSEKAIIEAKYIANIHVPVESKINESGKLYIPSFDEWDYNPNSSFLHYCDNETVEGLEFQYTPKFPGQLLVTDVSSNFLTRPMEWDKLDILYSHGQKNVGIAGSSITIIREGLLNLKKSPVTPFVCDYSVLHQADGKPNSLPIVPIYVNSLMFRYIKECGGVEFWDDYCRRRSQKIYQVIDDSHGFYINPVVKEQRSRINVAFNLRDEAELQTKFFSEAAQFGIIEIKGHRSRGGCRVCLYIPTSDIGLDNLVHFMEQFAQKYSS